MRAIFVGCLLCLSLLVGCGTSGERTNSATIPATPLPATAAPAIPEPTATASTIPATAAPANATATPAPTAIVPSPTVLADVEIDPENERVVAERSRAVLTALQQRDTQQLATLVHPAKGVRFSPYASVSAADLVFPAADVAAMSSDPHAYTWGAFDGSGFPIELTSTQYFDRFVYSHDFAQATQISFNQRIGQGNSSDTSRSFYGPDAMIVEYHIPGVEPKYEGLDWASLRLVFEKSEQQWYLTGIIHDQWTI